VNLRKHLNRPDGLGRNRPACGILDAWRFTYDPERVTCEECRRILESEEQADGERIE